MTRTDDGTPSDPDLEHVPDGQITIALAGNPNSGKTTVFNAITGARQHVGNYPGVTVEKKMGHTTVDGLRVGVVDLPGTYSLTAYSLEELVARDFIIEGKPEVVVHVADASNLERNLYLATQFIELGVPTVVALNMYDMALDRGLQIDIEMLQELLGVPMVPTVGSREEGIDELMAWAIEVAREGRKPAKPLPYGRELEAHIAEVEEVLESAGGVGDLPSRWVAIKLLEGDSQVTALTTDSLEGSAEIIAQVERIREHLEQVVGDDAEMALADRRYGFVNGACAEATSSTRQKRIDWSEAIDNVMTSRLLGLPLFLLMMWGMFELVFRLGAPPMGWLETLFGWMGSALAEALPDGPLESVLVDGIIGGVGGVLVFVPQILLLFLCISLLEDSGYMSRAAFVVDKLMHRIGLHGKSFIPMLVGFGCTVPAIMATRTLESRRDRLTTMLITPLMSCGARLPVYVLLAGAFFAPQIAGKVIFSIYLLGVILAVIMAKVLRSTILQGPTTPFVMELPPYRVPTVKGTLIHMWERGWQYVRKAGTIILAASVIMWALLTYPGPPANIPTGPGAPPDISYTAAGRIGKTIEPVMRPLGFDWKISISLIAGFAAKEIVVSTMGTTYAIDDNDETSGALTRALQADPHLNPLIAFTMMVFVLIYVPCFAAVAVMYRESGSWKWAALMVGYTTTLAWIVSFIVYQGGTLLGL